MVKGRKRKIRIIGDPILSQKTKPAEKINKEILQLIADLKVTMLAREGLGLAANQIGVPVSVIAINPKGVGIEAEPFTVINPELLEISGEIEREEGCLSIPGINEVITRPTKVIVQGLDEAGKTIKLTAEGFLARVFMHEIDHINGVFFIDHLGKTRIELLKNRIDEIKQSQK